MLGGEIWEPSRFLLPSFLWSVHLSVAWRLLLFLLFSSSPELASLQALFQHAPSKPTQCLFTHQLWFSQDKILQMIQTCERQWLLLALFSLTPPFSFSILKRQLVGPYFSCFISSTHFPSQSLAAACTHSFFLKYALLTLALCFLYLCSYYYLH